MIYLAIAFCITMVDAGPDRSRPPVASVGETFLFIFLLVKAENSLKVAETDFR